MKKRFLGITLAAALLVTSTISAGASQTYAFDQQFNYMTDEVTVGEGSNFDIAEKTNNTVLTSEKYESNDVLKFHLDGAGANDAAQNFRVQKNGNTNLFSQPGSSMVIKTRMKFDNKYRKVIQAYASGQTYVLLEMADVRNNAAGVYEQKTYYTIPGSTSKEVEGKFVGFNEWHDVVFVFKEGGTELDTLYAYVDGEKLYSENIPADKNFNGLLKNMTFQQGRTTHTIPFNWYIDYLQVGEYTSSTATVAATKEVTEGDIFELAPSVSGSYTDYNVEIPAGSPLTYDKLTGKFTAGTVETITSVTVKFNFVDELIPDVTSTITVEPSVEPILPSEIQQNVFAEDINLTVGQSFGLNNLFSVLPANADDTSLRYEIVGTTDVISTTGDTLTALKAGTAKVKVTAVGKTDVTKEVDVKVNAGNFDVLNNMLLTDTWDTKNETHSDFISLAYGKEYSPISVVSDPVFGKAIKFTGVGTAANAGASHLDKYVSASSLTANKDYKISGWVKLDAINPNPSSTHIDIKAFGYTQEGTAYAFAYDAPYTTSINIAKTTLASGNWYYFETDAFNMDVNKYGKGLEGVKIEIASYNNQAGVDAYVSNLAFVEQATVTTTGYEVSVDDALVTANTELDKVVGDSFSIVTHAIPSTGSVSLTYSSSDETIATVSATGEVTILNKSGEVTITVTDGTTNRTFKINVTKPVEEITAENTSVEVTMGNRNNSFDFTITPADATSALKTIVANSGICTAEVVNGKLFIVPVAVGTTTVKIVSEDDETIFLEFTVTVKEAKATNITLTSTSETIQKNQTVTIVATTTPTGKTVTFTSADATIATVNASGVVTGLKAGTTTITVQADDITATFTVTVIISATGIEVPEREVSLEVGGIYEIAATVTPTDKTDSISYASSNNDVATVDANGKVTAIGAGEVTITITCGTAVQTITVTVTAPQSNNTTIIVVSIVAGVAAVSALGLAFFFLKKKKR